MLANPALNGIDFLEVSTSGTTLRVYFQKDLPPGAYGLPTSPGNISVTGGVRILNIQVVQARRADTRLLEVDVSTAGDFTTYTLIINSASLDPVYAQVDFNFHPECPKRFDCKPVQDCPPKPADDPVVDYLAKDYLSFRQALLDFIALRIPQWQERHEADLGITLLDLLAYTGDQLSYFQDSVANEPYLETALQRISVRRHARLIDYRMHDGVSARTFIHFQLQPGAFGSVPLDTPVLARIDTRLGALFPPFGPVLPSSLGLLAESTSVAVFQTMWTAIVDARLNFLSLYPWADERCCLPSGSTSVDLVGDLTNLLHKGDLLLFEEVKGPLTGVPEDADRTHRQVVRLIQAQRTSDPLTGSVLTHIQWNAADALTFPLCISSRKKDGSLLTDVSVARGNLVLADHGRRIQDPWYPADPTVAGSVGISVGSRPFRFQLEDGPLSYRILSTATDQSPVADLVATDPTLATAEVRQLIVQSGSLQENDWQPLPKQSDLLNVGPFDHYFAAETNNDGAALLRFGDNQYGQSPQDGSFLRATYRIGVGIAGNVGADALAHVIDSPALPPIALVRNPLPAWGGIDPEPIDRVKHLAPAAFRAQQFRAVTEADYAEVAERNPLVARAVARFRWTGSWLTVFLTIDPRGRTDLPPDLRTNILNWVQRFTMAGYDLEIEPPIYVPLDIEIDICVSPDHFRGDVYPAILQALSNRRLVSGTTGFFFPDNFTFGQPLYLSKLYATIQAVEGVNSATVRRFHRIDESDPGPSYPATALNLDRGYIQAGEYEVLRLDNDPNFPENGTLRLNMLGGK